MLIPLFTGFYTSPVVVWDFWTINSRMESWMIYDLITLPKTDIAPENMPSQKEN